jgi:ribosome maturation factor RimP
MNTDVAKQVECIARPLVSSHGMELVEIEYQREGRTMVLRLYIDREGGVSLDDCAAVSRELSAVLDVEETVPGKYILEVSSPGLNRPLKTREDYARYKGRLVKIKTNGPLQDEQGNLRRTFLGELEGIEDDFVCLHLREGQKARIPFDRVAKANLEYEF